MTTASFSSLSLIPALLQSVESLSYTHMTAIQQQSLPAMLAGKDVLAKAKTGSGKTAAFSLALLSKIDTLVYKPQALVLCPTRELAEQVSKEIRALARFMPNVKLLTLCGGSPIIHQINSLEQAPHIVVGTPGRVLDHLNRDTLYVDYLKVLVLDEADRMLDMGFEEDIHKIIKKTPPKRQSLLFSATYPDAIQGMSQRVLQSPVVVSVESEDDYNQIEQHFIEAAYSDKAIAVMKILAHYRPESTVIFCNTKADCNELTEFLDSKGFDVLTLHGDLEQRDREQVLLRFSNKSCPILVATDVAARGLDIKELGAVINFELAYDPEIHVHRIGRTGRAGNQGLAFSLCAPKEAPRVVAIEDYQKINAHWLDLSELHTPVVGSLKATMVTICIEGGRKDKLRPTDILGALTGEGGLAGADVGKIDIFDIRAYVAVKSHTAPKALKRLQAGQIKGRRFRVTKVV
ncbi:MAG TPA: ATP-dependent RNA helicase DbpA [Agitococcus sp.]|nr:ATP-dependent RNA helicase DbpA [Moraxellaceae bacterium]MCC6374605.1 ATP-dependent RNA helicase DbpA [Moraxellaceae bacterium]HQV81207.1 ATP-dependent RNA helicase DbpA [Agitococcus sp.]